jgi:hypothetical protein
LLTIEDERLGVRLEPQVDRSSVSYHGRFGLDVVLGFACPERRLESAANETGRAVRGTAAPGGIGDGVHAPHQVAELESPRRKGLRAEPRGDGVVDLPDRAVAVDQHQTDIHDVKHGLEIGPLLGEGGLGAALLADVVKHEHHAAHVA